MHAVTNLKEITLGSPKMGKKIRTPAELKSLIRNILLATPEFPIFCRQLGISPVPNPSETNMLAQRYPYTPGDINMPVRQNIKVCTHIKVTGVRCGSPALRGEEFCYFHQRMMRGVRTPPQARLHPIALLENEEAIQASIMEVVNALARNTIDLRRAELMLKALYIAVMNSRRVHFEIYSDSMVKQVPEYAAPPARPMPPPGTPAVDESALANPPLTAQEIAAHRKERDAQEAALRKPPHSIHIATENRQHG
jgi:hypothetical protein